MRMTNLHKADPALKIYVAASHHHSTLKTVSDLAHPEYFYFPFGTADQLWQL